MISDALAECVWEIDRYLSDDAFAGTYDGEIRSEIVALRDQMDAMRVRLDTPPAPPTRETIRPGMRNVGGEWRYSAAWL